MNYPKTLIEIIDFFKYFPGVGGKSAERMCLSLLKWDKNKVAHFATLLENLHSKVSFCDVCGNISEIGELCYICKKVNRNVKTLCIVEEFTQISSIEGTALYKGLYHVLGGKLSPLNDINPRDLNIDKLIKRIEENDIQEIIFALSPDIEGQSTVIYISDLLKSKNIKITKLAQGIPAGADISFADSATIAAAINGRIDC